MKQFEIPAFYRSPIISKVKAKRKLDDPRKKDFTPSFLDFGNVKFYIARHFGFCYGVENAIEIAYRAIIENPNKKIFLLSEMIHNPDVNADLTANGIRFIQDTDGSQLINWSELSENDIAIIPAFGTTVEIEGILKNIGINIEKYNTTCPFVEKVWNRSEKLGSDAHTIIIHGKYNHEETRATFSRSIQNAPALIIKDIEEAKFLGAVIQGKVSTQNFYDYFDGKHSEGFDPEKHLLKIGVVNQTTMLASDTQEITEFLREVMIDNYGSENIKNHIADTRDTLCYATNDNQSATHGLMETDADLAIVIGGHNSSNTTHLVELLEQKFKTFFIRSANDINEKGHIQDFNIHTKQIEDKLLFSDDKKSEKIIITSGASCPDSITDGIIQKILELKNSSTDIQKVIDEFVINPHQ